MSPPLEFPPDLYRRLREFSHRRIADPGLADDLTQDALARALAGAGRLRDPAKLEAWLFQTLRNTIIDHYRTLRQGRISLFADLGMDQEALAAPDSEAMDTSPAAAAEWCMGIMLDTLDGDDGKTLNAVYRHGESQHALARRLAIPAATAKSRVQRARQRLRRIMEDCCHIKLNAAGEVEAFRPLTAEQAARCGLGGCRQKPRRKHEGTP